MEARLKGMQSGQLRRGGVQSDAALKTKRFAINSLSSSLLVDEAADDSFRGSLVPEVEPNPTFESPQSLCHTVGPLTLIIVT